VRSIAKTLGYSPSAISQEICRNVSKHDKGGRYDHEAADRRARRRRAQAKRDKRRHSDQLIDYVKEKLRLYWSPEQISNRLKLDYPRQPRMRISFKTIYRWLGRASYSAKPDEWKPFTKYLRLKRSGKRFQRVGRDGRSRRDRLPSIDDRPPQVDLKQRFGDWECDLIQGKGPGHVVTLVERSSGLLVARHCADKSVATVNRAILASFDGLARRHIRTITVDRGREFYGYEVLAEKLEAQVYFCHPQSPQERGLNEQVNGLLRQFFPKRAPMKDITQSEVQKSADLINNRPKKKFGYRTTREVIAERNLAEVLSFA
jgi:IS30 family transposase